MSVKLMLSPLEGRDVPAQYIVTLVSTGGDTAATLSSTVQLQSNPAGPNGGILVTADTAQGAAVGALTGSITANYQGKSTNYAYSQSKITYDKTSHANNESFFVNQPDAVGQPQAWQVGLEDLSDPAFRPAGVDPDWDYNDFTVLLKVALKQDPAPVGTGAGLLARVYNDPDGANGTHFDELALAPYVDPTVDHPWGDGSPDPAPNPAVGIDHFSLRWTGQVQPLFTEIYTFKTVPDDGMRVTITSNGVSNVVVDDFTDHSVRPATGTIALTAGQKYAITVEYYENTGSAEAHLLWSSDNQAEQVVPQSQLYPEQLPPVDGKGDGLVARYFDNQTLTGPAKTIRVDPQVNNTLGAASPIPGVVPADHFSVRWTGVVTPRYSGTYTFYTQSDDGVQLSVNGRWVIVDWNDHGPTQDKVKVPDLVAGRPYIITMEYYENAGDATAVLLWSSDGDPKAPIPKAQLGSNYASVGDFVWNDANGNGIQDAGEGGVAGATVNLLTAADGAVDQTATTGADGKYRFDYLNLLSGYLVQVIPPAPNPATGAGYLFTQFQAGTSSATDSDVNPGTGKTAELRAGAAGLYDDVDAGLVPVTEAGPAAVPGNSTYTYTLTAPGDNRGRILTWAPRSVDPKSPLPAGLVADAGAAPGTAADGVYDPVKNVTTYSENITFLNTSPADVLLDVKLGAMVVTTKEVYLVQVKVDTPPGAFTAAATLIDKGFFDITPGGFAYRLISSRNPKGLVWTANVTLVGPGKNLGVDQIHAGFIQRITLKTLSGEYAPGGVAMTLNSTIEKNSYLDQAPDFDAAGAAVPDRASPDGNSYTGGSWYDRQSSATFFTANAAAPSKPITAFDSPGFGPPEVFQKAASAPIMALPGGFDYIRKINLVWTFTLDVAATTTDPANGADGLYWAEARASNTKTGATGWSFDATGTFAPVFPFPYTQTGAGVTAPDTWSSATAPDQEGTSGVVANKAIASSAFK